MVLQVIAQSLLQKSLLAMFGLPSAAACSAEQIYLDPDLNSNPQQEHCLVICTGVSTSGGFVGRGFR